MIEEDDVKLWHGDVYWSSGVGSPTVDSMVDVIAVVDEDVHDVIPNRPPVICSGDPNDFSGNYLSNAYNRTSSKLESILSFYHEKLSLNTIRLDILGRRHQESIRHQGPVHDH